MIIVGKLLIGLGLFFIAAGVYGLYRFGNFYARLLVAAKIDAVGSIFLFSGVMFLHGLSMFSLKALLILVLMICINPLSSHTLARLAHTKGYALRKTNYMKSTENMLATEILVQDKNEHDKKR